MNIRETLRRGAGNLQVEIILASEGSSSLIAAPLPYKRHEFSGYSHSSCSTIHSLPKAAVPRAIPHTRKAMKLCALLVGVLAVCASLAFEHEDVLRDTFNLYLTPDGCQAEVMRPFIEDPCGPFGTNRTLSKPPYLLGNVETPDDAVFTLCCLMQVCIPELISGMLCQSTPPPEFAHRRLQVCYGCRPN
ncbi:hypothetical protein QR680_000497 [Steinernema hermaphroditum]|uniref:Uncharacterized protein n=1 Tax=Steinernema hermaphroditum TaxID=289476 RepID=A0AA39GWS5_9BILA|nr:hypothetical protein QR680_000497 [Steinernema hermaphroditum]